MSVWKRIALAGLSFFMLGIEPAGAAPPRVTVTAATPPSAYQGDTLDVIVNGSGFDPSAKAQYFMSGTTSPGGVTVRSVKYISSTELVTTIEVSGTANEASFDIVVTLDSGRKGKGTTLFTVKAKGNPNNPPPPAPTYPAARHWHAFTSNGGTTAATSRLYMFGGAGGAQLQHQDLDDLWVYTNAGSGAKWTLVPPESTAPGPRHHVAWSCGGGYCVMSGGVPRYDETWVYSESSGSWTQLNCSRRAACPTRRAVATMAYDPVAGRHVLFGGTYNWSSLGDTWSFSASNMKWTNHGSSSSVAARVWAAATFVPPVGRVVLFGGSDDFAGVFSDMYLWDGTVWIPVAQVVDDTVSAVPTLMNHSMAWDPIGSRLIVTGGLKDMNDTPNTDTFYVTFASQGGGWRANWTRASGIGCQSTSGSSDSTIHPQARMAFGIPSGVQVFFGGVENLPDVGAWAYDNTVECY